VITRRTTRLIRVADLSAFRTAVAELSCRGGPLDARDRLVVVPTRAAAEQLRRSLEDRTLPEGGTLVLPDLLPVSELVLAFLRRLSDVPLLLEAEREVLLGVACRTARAAGFEPPLRLRPGLVTEMLRFYDTLRLNQKTVDAFERLALGMLEPGAADDRGAERLVRQTRFLVAAFRDFEARCAQAGLDHHGAVQQLLETAATRPYRHVVVTVGDRTFDPVGLAPAHWDLLTRVPGLEHLDVVATDRAIAGTFHEAIHRLLPGLEEVRFDSEPPSPPSLVVPAPGEMVHRPRDREEEVAGFARLVKGAVRTGHLEGPTRAALVVQQRLPYVYVAREIFRSAGVPCQMFDALPLAAEPFAAALDVVLAATGSTFARGPAAALLRSPHLGLGVTPREVDGLDRALAEESYLGDPAALERLVARWEDDAGQRRRMTRAARAGRVLLTIANELAPLQERRPLAAHLDTLLAFLSAHDAAPPADDSGAAETLRARHLRARAAVLSTLTTLRDAFARFDDQPVTLHDVRALVRRWIDAQTFAPRTGDGGVHVVDTASARFGEFDLVQLAGLVEGEWPEPPRRDIFYSTAVLRELGWPSELERLQGERAAFSDLITLPARRLIASSFLLEADALVSPSPFVEELAACGLPQVEASVEPRRIFDYEALAAGAPRSDVLDASAASWAALRIGHPAGASDAYRGQAGAYDPPPLSLSAIERYVDCPFKFFAADVLRLEEPPEDDAAVSPRARGRFVHQALQRFFEAWDREGAGPVTPENLGLARAVFAAAVEPLLAALSDTDAAHERARLFGSAISPGVAETVLALEASRQPEPVGERWLEHRLEGDFTLGDDRAQPVALRGVADRIDLLPGRRLRVIDYKSGSAPQTKLALQAPIYALCAQERLSSRDGAAWSVDEAAYVSLRGPRTLVPVVKAGSKDGERLADARGRVLDVLANVRSGLFPPRPLDEMSCRWCAYASVCRKDYVGDE
jgi:ATP-dependent helicase/nuclease subunit B